MKSVASREYRVAVAAKSVMGDVPKRLTTIRCIGGTSGLACGR
jgi:hypothetical protein